MRKQEFDSRHIILKSASALFSNHKDISTDLKQTDCQIFIQQKWICLGSVENCNSRCATMESLMQVPAKQVKNTFKEVKRKLGGLK